MGVIRILDSLCVVKIFCIVDAERNGKAEIGTVGAYRISECLKHLDEKLTCLVPSLHCSSDGAKNNSEVHGLWLTPFMDDFIAQSIFLGFVQALNFLELGWILSAKSALFQQLSDVGQFLFFCECINLSHESSLRDTGQRILDPVEGSVQAIAIQYESHEPSFDISV